MGVLNILDILSLLIDTSKHIPITENLALQSLDDGADMCVLLKAGIIEVDEFGAVIENVARFDVSTNRTITIVSLDFSHIFLYGFLRCSEDAR